MTQKEIDKLLILTGEIIENTTILHPPAADLFTKQLLKVEDKDILDVLINHVRFIRIYEIYNRFNAKASENDITALLDVIEKLGKQE